MIEETIVESNAIVEAIEEAIEEHRVDTEATKFKRPLRGREHTCGSTPTDH